MSTEGDPQVTQITDQQCNGSIGAIAIVLGFL
jgi:hypothetical protein